MGRPKGDGARSKSRPSSSSLAASLLPQGSTPVGFGGYMGCSRVDSTEDSPPFLDIDSEVAQHLKRLSRKDPTTKLKALTSLSQLFQQKTAKEIIPITPQWAFEYKKLLLDYNREVRRATHVTMTNLVGVVGRDIAPYLKSLMGPWWFSQFDSAYEVSQAAKRSFQAAFPAQDKRLDVLILYTSEIFRYIEENLKLTPQSMSDKNVASDELEEMHKQVVSSSLLALATLLDIVVTAQSERPVSEAESKRASKAKSIAISCAENLLTTHKLFLEFLKSQSSAIRSATYSVMRSLIKNIPHAIKKTDIIDLADAILGAFRETDPSCHSSMWDVILLFSRKFPESWSSLKIKKSALSRFWHFLRNGCFGSQQVSYPALVLFLDVVPAQAVEAQKFLLEVLQNLWAGRSLSYSSHLDRLALFEAMKECFLFSLKNTDRYSDAADPYRFQQTLADQILLKLLWHEYLFSVSSNNQERVFSSMDFSSGGIQPSHQASRQLNVKVTEGYAQDLGKCIVEILTDIFLLEPDLLLLFCSTFQETCLGVFQETDSSIENGEGVTEFLSVVNQQAVRKGETWPLVYLVGPTLSKSFPLIRTLDSPNAVRFMVAAVSIFSPRKIIQEIFCIEPEGNQFLHVFKETFIPWCLQANSPTTSVRLDLLLSLLDDEYLAEQWASIIMHATNLEELKSVNGIVSSDCLSLLAMLIEKAITRTSNRSTVQVPYAAHWHHHLLDSAAVFVVQAFPPFGSSNVSYMRAVLGGIAGDDETNFLSRSTLVLVFEEILKKLTVFMMDSPFIWVKVMCSVIPVRDNNTELGFEPSMDVNEMADFALQVLDGGFSALKCLHHEVELLSGILAAIFVIKWECSMATVFNNKLGEESTEKIKSRFASCELVHALHRKICNQFLFSINTDSRNILESILVQTVRSAVLKDENMDTVEVTSLCSHWVLELLECLCQDQFEVQKLLDRFLSQDDSWPVWVAPDIKVGKGAALVKTESASIDNPKGTRFVALIDRLIPKMGFDKIIAGAVSNTSSSLTEDHINQPTTTLQCHYSRAWLAAEILCTWKWNGGNALCSFLPYLCEYFNSECYTPEDELLGSIVTILLDGALIHGGVAELSLSNLSPVTHVENIREPFMRAVISLVSKLFEDDVWGKDKAVFLFNQLLNKLHIDETINRNCLRILPSVMDVIVRPLSVSFGQGAAKSQSASSDCCEVQQAIINWLQRTQSFPPLNAWQTLLLTFLLLVAKHKEKKKTLEEQNPSEVEGKMGESIKKKSKKKKKETHTVTMETIAENPNNISPMVGYFPSGYDPLRNTNDGVEELSTKLYRNVRRNNRLQVVVSPYGSQVDFVGTNYSGEATSAQLCTYSLGILDKETQTLKIVPIAANKIIRLEPRVRGSEVPDAEDPDTAKQELTAEERNDKMRELTQMYSSKKSIRQARKLDSLRQQEDTGNQEEFDRNIAGAINKEALEVTVATDSARNIPPHDLDATIPQLAYPLDRIISKGEWDFLLDIFELTEAGAEMTPDLYPSFVRNRSYKLEHIQDEDEKKRLAGILSFITHLVKFKDKHSMDGVSSAKHHKFPGILSQKFTSMFSISDSKRLPEEKVTLLINYVLVLTLFADDFRSDPSDIAKDLRINAVALRPFYEYLGCKLVREKNIVLATLPVPLVFPGVRRKRRR